MYSVLSSVVTAADAVHMTERSLKYTHTEFSWSYGRLKIDAAALC